MALTVQNIAFDCADAFGIATFWSRVLGLPLADDDKPGDPVAVIERPDGPTFYFEQVPEPKTAPKNRVHVCLQAGTDRDAEVERVRGLGATVFADHRNDEGGGWVVFQDPEGNEFCVLGRAA